MNDLQAQLEEVSKEKQELQEKVGSTDIGHRHARQVKPEEQGGTQRPTAHTVEGTPCTLRGAEQSRGDLPCGMGAEWPSALLQGGMVGDQGGCGQG